jgi:adenylosuccinate lyase
MDINTLESISPIDGRYRGVTENISKYFSEYAYIKYRVIVEVKWLEKILNTKEIVNANENIDVLEDIISNFNLIECERVKEFEATTNHDVKAIEYYVREKIKGTQIEKYSHFVHFACTSEDINNIAHSLMLKDALEKEILPQMDKLISSVKDKAKELKELPLLAHTHGQGATPTTVGKELAVFVYRWEYIKQKLESIKLKSKFNGATGNFAAHSVCIDLDWIKFAKDFVESFGLEYNPLVTQIESHDTICEVMSYIKLFNNITMDFNQDMWTYISMKYFKQKAVATETGSSVMPHKVNPINHENSMANIRMANSIIDNFTNNLQISRMQRDLSDSSNLRNIGVVLAHTLISIIQSIKGFNKMEPNEKVLFEELESNPEVLAEAIQTVLRKNGYNNAYEMLKELTRGKEVTLDTMREFVTSLDIPNTDKDKLLKLTPTNYVGLSSKLVEYIK